MIVKLLSEHHLEFLSLKGGFTGWSESTLVKMPHCWKSNVKAHIFLSDTGFEVPDLFVVGYALDYNEYFRDLNVSTNLK